VLPVLASVGPFTFFTFTVLIDLGIVAGLGWLYRAGAADGDAARARRWLDAGIAAVVGGLAGGRLGYVFANWAYFSGHVGEAVRVWEGGLAWPGAAAGAALALWMYCRLRGEPFWLLAETLTLPLLLLAALAWLGCAANACAPGREVAPGELPAWFAQDWPDEFGIRALRWPVQLLGLAWSLALMAGLAVTRRQAWQVGVRPLLALAGIAAGGLALAFVRGDAMPEVSGLRLDAVANVAVLIVSLALFAFRSRARNAQSIQSIQM
jgi:phosphatidylglycerol:prolipoprotein diacylglycerol transferase